MYLKSLTLRGFKSFASVTSLRLEPGITCVVGPNGSGKSNIVDALSWVMGEQGAKSLRGGKMEDVVFAGTTSRPPLGRAEVTLTIDNSDGALPIEYAEVTISRLMFRSGQSEYAINGDHCRLLDVQELLSDSGLGREMHVIVGQGQLDDILHAGPEARRALIEEAAGVLKHRKRKEKALRKLEAMQANLTRLVDLTAELSRRLKPLGRQAEVARKAAVIQAELRDARLRLLADDYVTLAADLQRDEADEAAVLARRAVLEQELAQARTAETELDHAAQQASAGLAQAQETWFALSSLAERLRSTQNLAAQRHSLLTEATEPERPGAVTPTSLTARPMSCEKKTETLTTRLAAGREVLSVAVAERTAAEAELSAIERRLAAGVRTAAARAERVAGLREQVGAADSRSVAAQEEMDRLEVSAAEARDRAAHAQEEYEQVQELGGGGTKTVASWPPRTSRPPGSWLNMPNGPRCSARRNANPLVSWPPGGPARRRWPKPRGAARTPPRPCSPTRPASAAWSVRSPRPCGWPRGTRWPSPRPWGPPPTRWRWPASTRPPRSWPPCAARTRAAPPWSSPPKAPSQRPRPTPEPLPTHGTPPPRQPHPPLRAPGRSAPRSWCGHRTGWRRPRPSFCATWWWSLTWSKHAGSFGKILVLRP